MRCTCIRLSIGFISNNSYTVRRDYRSCFDACELLSICPWTCLLLLASPSPSFIFSDRKRIHSSSLIQLGNSRDRARREDSPFNDWLPIVFVWLRVQRWLERSRCLTKWKRSQRKTRAFPLRFVTVIISSLEPDSFFLQQSIDCFVFSQVLLTAERKWHILNCCYSDTSAHRPLSHLQKANDDGWSGGMDAVHRCVYSFHCWPSSPLDDVMIIDFDDNADRLPPDRWRRVSPDLGEKRHLSLPQPEKQFNFPQKDDHSPFFSHVFIDQRIEGNILLVINA